MYVGAIGMRRAYIVTDVGQAMGREDPLRDRKRRGRSNNAASIQRDEKYRALLPHRFGQPAKHHSHSIFEARETQPS